MNKTMPMFLDIDRFLTKKDFRSLKNLKWPWNVTHFLLSETCPGCHSVVSTNTRDLHLIKNQEDIRSLLYQDWFWCENCSTYAIYDHFSGDECEMCN